jgi:dihydrofolate reductase
MITLIAAFDENRVIGRDDTLPWHLPEDFKHFKATTLDHPIVMGRKTYDSLPRRPLPRRRNLVVSRSPSIEGAEVFSNVEAALAAGLDTSDEVFVIGGQSIYEQTIDIAQRMIITHVYGRHDGNYWFPEISQRWHEASVISETADFRIVEYLITGS